MTITISRWICSFCRGKFGGEQFCQSFIVNTIGLEDGCWGGSDHVRNLVES